MRRKRARSVVPATHATISNYLDAVISRKGVTLVRERKVTFLNEDEMDRLAEEWRLFRKQPGEPDPGAITLEVEG